MADVRVAAESSDSSLSPIPSPQNANGSRIIPEDTIRVSLPPAFPRKSDGVVAATENAKNTTTPNAEKVKKPRKKKEPTTDTKVKSEIAPKEKKPRKPRNSNTDATTTATAGPSRKKQKIEDASTIARPSQQSTITSMMGNSQSNAESDRPSEAAAQKQSDALQPTVTNTSARNHLSTVNGQAEARPVSSGQRYDPIRGLTIDPVPSAHASPSQATAQVHRASASPSVSSLINPSSDMAISSISLHTTASNPQSPTLHIKAATNIPASQAGSQPTSPTSLISAKPFAAANTQRQDDAMDLDEHPTIEPATASKVVEEKSKPASPAATPKGQRPTPPQTKPQGKGLLSSSDLFGGPTANGDTRERHGVNIDIVIKLNPKGSNTVNMAQEIMKKYGIEALNPREAARREQRAAIDAMANKLEQGSGDDMSVDLSDGDNDSNVEMGGMDNDKDGDADGKDGAGDKPVRRRRRKIEDYDKEDDFIDDTELAWEEQAAVAQDGFFVYSGPLVQEPKPAPEGTSTSARGRGRGRGRGGRTTAAAANGLTHATLAAKAAESSSAAPSAATSNAGSTTAAGKGRGRARGTGAPRKPRATKAEKEKVGPEKGQPAQTAVAAGNGPSASTATSTTAATSAPLPATAPSAGTTATSTAVATPTTTAAAVAETAS